MNIECTQEHGFFLEVMDSERIYKAIRYYRSMEQIEVEGIEIIAGDMTADIETKDQAQGINARLDELEARITALEKRQVIITEILDRVVQALPSTRGGDNAVNDDQQ